LPHAFAKTKQEATMRDTAYATELQTAQYHWGAEPDPNNHVRIERLFVKPDGDEEIRFGWWSNGNLVIRPVDMTETQWAGAIAVAFDQGIFTDPAAVARVGQAALRFLEQRALQAGG
jgi:hypothetical protein